MAKIVVLAGGMSCERDISLESGRAVSEAIKKLGHEVILLDAQRDLSARLVEIKPDIVFNALHGTYGEDGAVAGILEFLGIPYTHSGVMASALGMDKGVARLLAERLGIPVAAGAVVNIKDLKRKRAAGEHPGSLPYVIKPISGGSALGVHIVTDTNDELAFLDDWSFNDEVIIEEYIPGLELSCAVLQGRSLGVIAIAPQVGFYDYGNKYTDGACKHIFPAPIPSDVADLIGEYAVKIHNATRCRTISRSDFRYDDSKGLGGICFLEINTHPGFVNLSLFPEIASYHGISFVDLIKIMLDDAKCDLSPYPKVG